MVLSRVETQMKNCDSEFCKWRRRVLNCLHKKETSKKCGFYKKSANYWRSFQPPPSISTKPLHCRNVDQSDPITRVFRKYTKTVLLSGVQPTKLWGGGQQNHTFESCTALCDRANFQKHATMVSFSD